LAQGFPFQAFHYDVRLAGFFTDVVNRADVGMVQRRGSAGFPLESLQGFAIAPNLLRKEFERYGAAQPGVLSLIDHPHAAAPKFLDDAIVGNRLAQPLLFALGGPAHLRVILGQGLGGHLEGRGLDKARPVLTLRQ
jgi:secreted protein with Ig-like and vWFA domain